MEDRLMGIQRRIFPHSEFHLPLRGLSTSPVLHWHLCVGKTSCRRNSPPDFVMAAKLLFTTQVDFKGHLPIRRGVNAVNSPSDIGFATSTALTAAGALLSDF